MKLNPPQFYYTVHPADTLRSRLIPNRRIMVVATAYWDAKKNKFRVRRPPADHIKSKAGRHARLAIDSGGFTAHKRWGKYPWSYEQYIEFIRKMSRDVTLDGHACPPYFCAVMDYACEREVNRSAYETNKSKAGRHARRIEATIENEIALRQLAPDLPWLGVLQGNTLEERAWDITQRQELELILIEMGIGSICGRSPRESKEVIRFYMQQLPHVRYHAFGLDIRAFDGADDVYWAIASWDSYTWCWGRGMKHMRDPQRQHIEGETWSQYTLRLAQQFEKNTLNKRLYARRQRNFFDLTLLAKSSSVKKMM